MRYSVITDHLYGHCVVCAVLSIVTGDRHWCVDFGSIDRNRLYILHFCREYLSRDLISSSMSTNINNTVMFPLVSVCLYEVTSIQQSTSSIYLRNFQGGIKAVIWTDVFQIGLMYASIVAIVLKGSYDLGGMDQVLKVAAIHDRVTFFK